jgi:tetratricopeptide (TPR) repeat protein
VAITLQPLGIAYGALGDHAKARDVLERALAINEQAHGPDHPTTKKTKELLAVLQSRAPPPDFDAEAEIANASKMRIKELQTALGKMGVSTRGMCEKTELVDAYVGALRDGKRPDAPADGDDKTSKMRGGGIDTKELERVRAIVERAEKAGGGGGAPGVGGVGDDTKELERLLPIFERKHGTDSTEVAALLSGLWQVYLRLGDYAKARDVLERALAINERTFGRDHALVAITLTNLGLTYGDLGDHAKKRDLLERALEIDERAYGSDHAELAITLMNLGNAYGQLGDQTKKRDVLERVLTIYEREHGSDSPQVALTLMNLGMRTVA